MRVMPRPVFSPADERRASPVALGIAVGLHVALALGIMWWAKRAPPVHEAPRVAIEMRLAQTKPAPRAPTPEPKLPQPTAVRPEPAKARVRPLRPAAKPARKVQPRPTQPSPEPRVQPPLKPRVQPPSEQRKEAALAAREAPAAPHMLPGMRATLPAPGDRAKGSTYDRVFARRGPLGSSLGDLEGALDTRDLAVGPTSDAKRAARTANRLMAEDVSRDVVELGLVDDYFRVLQTRLERAWDPRPEQLNDGGKQVGQVGFMLDAARPAGYGEIWRLYLDLANQFATTGQKPKIRPAELDRIRELMRSRRSPFRLSAIAEVVTQISRDGKLLAVTIPLSSGHPAIDSHIQAATSRALTVMPETPPKLVSGDGSFRARWRFRVTWIMIPPTAFFTGAGFDITPEGITFDVPFDVKRQTRIKIMTLDKRNVGIGG